jgi:hypothetical protein
VPERAGGFAGIRDRIQPTFLLMLVDHKLGALMDVTQGVTGWDVSFFFHRLLPLSGVVSLNDAILPK